MEEDGAVKAPVTRLRRRLSVEQSDDTKSPSAPSTPTKKRGRLATKPQLELIEENASQSSPAPRTTRKSIARDIAEPVEEKAVTPSRRSTRVKSNTSIVSETIQSFDSPRTTRAARRNSQAGSDNEAPVTPARITRRTRRDSTSSMDKTVVPSGDTPVKTPARTRRTRKGSTSSVDKEGESEVTSSQGDIPDSQFSSKNIMNDVINEEPESELRKSLSSDTTDSRKSLNVSPLRKSPRLQAKKSKTSESKDESSDRLSQDSDIQSVKTKDESKSNIEIINSKYEDIPEGNIDKNSSQSKLSTSCRSLLDNLDIKPTKKTSNLNKSMSVLGQENNIKSKRQRTKSWTTLIDPNKPKKNEENFYSDNESVKNKLKKHEKLFSMRLNPAASGDNILNKSDDNNEIVKENSERFSKSDKDTNLAVTSIESNEGNVQNSNANEFLFQKAPSEVIQSMVFIDDSDSESLEQQINIHVETGDQCVPIVPDVAEEQKKLNHSSDTGLNDVAVTNIFSGSNTNRNNDTCEPMDVDETINENILHDVAENINVGNDPKPIDISSHNTSLCNPKNNETVYEISNNSKRKSSICDLQDDNVSSIEKSNKTKRKSSISNVASQISEKSFNSSRKSSFNNPQEVDACLNEETNNSKRKSSVSNLISQESEKSSNENKSTLVLSQLKDSSSSLEPSPKSKSFNVPNVDKVGVLNHNISLNCCTSTPVQQKDVTMLKMEINTSIITSKNDSKKKIVKQKSPSQDKESDSSDSDSDEQSSRNSNLLDNEAEETSEDYESGDSQDEDERQYEKDHEILERGVTLTTEDESSDDSDYEKDSFIVSSEEEDEELLSGSGEDLNMGDNELTMSAKSKKKFDERMRKRQKKASKEMYNARHNLDNPSKNSKGSKHDKSHLDSTQESEVGVMVPPKKNKRMRLDSNWESSTVDESDIKKKDEDRTPNASEIVLKKKTKAKRLSESINEKEEKETEVDSTINESTTSEIGRKKKKAKRLSESFCETTLNDQERKETLQDNTTLDTSDNILIKKKKKNKRLSEPVCEPIQEEKKLSKFEKANIVSTSSGDEIFKKTNKHKRFSESIHNDSVMTEKEITVCENSVMEKEDPLFVQVKQEPKTPQKTLDISTVNFTTREEIEEVKVDENLSMMRANDTSDPLREIQEDNKSDISSLSENENAINNYESVLDELNKRNNKIRTHDISLNLNKKTKQSKNPIMEQLNITLTKNVNKKKNSSDSHKNKVKSIIRKVTQSDEEATSDSIDLKLLFSEDSNDSSSNKESNSKTEYTITEKLIPLKRTEGKTNISVHSTSEVENELSATKKKKKRKTSQNENTNTNNTSENEENIFFIDTVGTRIDTSVNSPRRKKDATSYTDNVAATLLDDDSNDGPLEVAYHKSGTDKTSNEMQEATPKSVGTDKQSRKKKMSASLNIEKSETHVIPQNLSLDSKNLKNKKDAGDITVTALVKKDKTKTENEDKRGKKRKREPSTENVEQKPISDLGNSQTHPPEEISIEKQKKRKTSETAEGDSHRTNEKNVLVNNIIEQQRKIKQIFEIQKQNAETLEKVQKPDSKKKGKKRKEMDEDDNVNVTKITKENFLDKIHVPRLPDSILTRLQEKPKKEVRAAKKAKIISTTEFVVEETKPKRAKPSNFLEESVYLNTDSESPALKKKANLKKPKVLPFLPTASTSDCGFTTKFQVNVLPQRMEFVAKNNNSTDFKTEYLRDKKMKKLRTYELYKQHRNFKLTKY